MSATKKSGKHSAAKDPLPLQPGDALILLRSAVSYVLQAGLRVGARNGQGGLILTVTGAQVVHRPDGADFVPQDLVLQDVVLQPSDVPEPVAQSAS